MTPEEELARQIIEDGKKASEKTDAETQRLFEQLSQLDRGLLHGNSEHVERRDCENL